jgi:hypothetical protein
MIYKLLIREKMQKELMKRILETFIMIIVVILIMKFIYPEQKIIFEDNHIFNPKIVQNNKEVSEKLFSIDENAKKIIMNLENSSNSEDYLKSAKINDNILQNIHFKCEDVKN